jgi:hypothetical protein
MTGLQNEAQRGRASEAAPQDRAPARRQSEGAARANFPLESGKGREQADREGHRSTTGGGSWS